MRQANALLRTTLFDGDSISVREALYLGVPVIASDNGMRPEGCVLIPPSDGTALLRAVEETVRHRSNVPPPSFRSGVENLELILQIYRRLLSGS
jgi:glycosyltransferase involved in cell wall biosynthesis